MSLLISRKNLFLAREPGLEVMRTLSILKELYENGGLAETPSTIYRHLIEIGFYIDKRLFDKVPKGSDT